VKKEIHPEYRTVLFHDVSVDKYYLIPSTLETDQTKEWEDGNTYPYCPLDVSSASHPFYTGQNKIIDTGGRVERFKKRFSKKAAVKAAPVEESPKEETPPVEEKEEDVKASAPAEEVTKEAPEATAEETTEAVEVAPSDAPQEETSAEEASDESSNSSEEK
jgi:large subunit ribosomal protein L31